MQVLERTREAQGIERDEIRLICKVVKPKVRELTAENERRMMSLEPSKPTVSSL